MLLAVVVAELQILAVPIHTRAIIIVRWVHGGGAWQEAAGGTGVRGRQREPRAQEDEIDLFCWALAATSMLGNFGRQVRQSRNHVDI